MENENKYKRYFANKHNTSPSNIDILNIDKLNNGKVNVRYKNNAEKKIERTRRITGYLSNLDRWNDSKQAEEKDRIKHI